MHKMCLKYLSTTIAALGLASMAHAGLTIKSTASTYESPTQSTARIAWGGSDSLQEAKNIMYHNIDNGYGTSHYRSSNNSSYQPSNTPNKIVRVDNGYGTTYSSNAYQSNQAKNVYDYLAISTNSKGAIVVDLAANKVIYEKNADIARPIASISKLLTAMVVLDAGQDMREEIQMEPEDFNGPKKASSRLRVGDSLNRAELILMMLMKSENPAAKTLARHYPGGYNAFIRAMNAKAQSIGMTTAWFGDPTGLDKRNVASPSDLVKLVKAAGGYDVIRRFSTTQNYNFSINNYNSGYRSYNANNTSRTIRAGVYPVGISKTGYISEAGNCVVMETWVNNRPAIVVLLGAKTTDARWNDADLILSSLSNRS